MSPRTTLLAAFLLAACRLEALELIILSEKDAQAFTKYISTRTFDTSNVPIPLKPEHLEKITFSTGPPDRVRASRDESLLKAIVKIDRGDQDRRLVYYFTVSPRLDRDWKPSKQGDWGKILAGRFLTQYQIIEVVRNEHGIAERVLNENYRKKPEDDHGGGAKR